SRTRPRASLRKPQRRLTKASASVAARPRRTVSRSNPVPRNPGSRGHVLLMSTMPARIKRARNGLPAIRASPLWTGRVLRGGVMVVSQESDSLLVNAVIQNPQFRKRRHVGDFAAERRDVLLLNG